MISEPLTPEQVLRFVSQVDEDESGCWIWTGLLDGGGYGRFPFRDRSVLPHRLAYEHFVGPIPGGLQLDHLCRVRHCVNPSHLEPVTCRENLMRAATTQAYANSVKTHCPQRHPYTPENTYIQRGGRVCRTCRLGDMYRRRQATKEALNA